MLFNNNGVFEPLMHGGERGIGCQGSSVPKITSKKYQNMPGLYNRLDADRVLQFVSLDEKESREDYVKLEVNVLKVSASIIWSEC